MMNPDLTLEPPVVIAESVAAFLPFNYLSAAFGAMLGRAGRGQNRMIFALPDPDNDLPARLAVISDSELADPERTAKFVASLDGANAQDREQERYALGPPTARAPADSSRTFDRLALETWRIDERRSARHAVVIIDAGIAFWHLRFRSATGCRFREVRYMDFDRPQAGLNDRLDEGEIDRLCRLSDDNGAAAVVAEIGRQFPNSFFGSEWNHDPDGLWHGTAVADLAAGDDGNGPDDIALFALELPMQVLRDSDGDTLTSVLAIAVDAAVRMAAGVPHLQLTILLPYGFTGGPQGGSPANLHRAARTLDRVLAPGSRANVRIIVPAGNHLQDQCHARLCPEDGGNVDWWVAPDDYSANQVEAFVPVSPGGAGSFRMQLTSPGGGGGLVDLPQPWSFQNLTRDGVRVGMAVRSADQGGHMRLRLALAPTAVTTTTPAPPHGRWQIGAIGTERLSLWLLRDDRDEPADRAFPRRASWFSDPDYRAEDSVGAPGKGDDPGSVVRRFGTLSVMATATHPAVTVVQADEQVAGRRRPAWYSGQRGDGGAVTTSALVDPDYTGQGRPVAANGGIGRMRMTGTSAAAALEVRAQTVGTPPPDL